MEGVYLGCGGVYLVREGAGLVIDPFFSNQKFGRIGSSVFFNRKTFRSEKRMVELGLKAMDKVTQNEKVNLRAILSAHSHYDHLMDIPAVYQHYNRNPSVLLSKSGYNIVHHVIDSTDIIINEAHMSTPSSAENPVRIPLENGAAINVYPILADHNPHFKNIKFFSGAQTTPSQELRHPFQKTRANLWLEGRTFSFLIDYVDPAGEFEYRVFIQSSSCNAPAGIPPEVLRGRKVDLAFIGVVSYGFSPGYPCTLLEAIDPDHIIWVHWEDFFRRYSRKPKTVRGTDLPGFFDIECVKENSNKGYILAPRVKFSMLGQQ